ncbi:BirA family biotin operon repressor/biotin-[acetyl-CoA-carboxylase] ligase [Sphingomonas aquatilis]|uniref:BirA family biotin operon repressor/biotin-[acetyl-CoA-carboxylase] ligase n=2 Tax=Sphingomonas aquatilis TaxID=93063 RepID=A0AAW3TPI4_9SPHN|nr:BirA family biotin operon repressor/biotin-[acetyl-CoA-carboxylase] ligase [Sphingomonas aquatilis]
MTANARALRTDATEAERLIWLRVRGHRPRFTRQLPVGRYIIDLACRSVKLGVEFDGSQHVDSLGDEARTQWLEGLGWRVIRFWNSDVVANPDGVAEVILAAVAQCGGPTHPRPLPSREGR